jgi:sugar lactone lactonase YvrE
MRIDAFDFDKEQGLISGGETVYDLVDERPDGMSIDENGNLNVAVWGANKVIVINPTSGKLINTLPTPALQTSCTAFGGKELDTMYITSASVNRLDDPKEILAGMLFSLKMPYKGVKANLFG